MIVKRIQTPTAGKVVSIELTCEDFDEEFSLRYSNKCSVGCAEMEKMFFTPKLHGSTIHARVCAGRWELVNKISREWWCRKAAPYLDWDEARIREETDPAWAKKVHREKYKSRSVVKTRDACVYCGKPVARGYDLCNECGEDEKKPKDSGSLDDLDGFE